MEVQRESELGTIEPMSTGDAVGMPEAPGLSTLPDRHSTNAYSAKAKDNVGDGTRR